jgi:hypothetical protein
MPIILLGYEPMKKHHYLLGLIMAAGFLLASPPVHAGTGQDAAYIARGAGKFFGSVFAIPKAMLQDSGRVMFPFGLVTGAVRGTVQMVGGIVGGAVDVAQGSAPYAKYAALAL